LVHVAVLARGGIRSLVVDTQRNFLSHGNAARNVLCGAKTP
jgi:hypothetical protein